MLFSGSMYALYLFVCKEKITMQMYKIIYLYMKYIHIVSVSTLDINWDLETDSNSNKSQSVGQAVWARGQWLTWCVLLMNSLSQTISVKVFNIVLQNFA